MINMKCPDCGSWMKDRKILHKGKILKSKTIIIEHGCPFCGTIKWSFLERDSKLQKEKVIFT